MNMTMSQIPIFDSVSVERNAKEKKITIWNETKLNAAIAEYTLFYAMNSTQKGQQEK